MTIVIEVNGNCVTGVYSDHLYEDTKIEIVDWDNIKDGDKPPKDILDVCCNNVNKEKFPFKLY